MKHTGSSFLKLSFITAAIFTCVGVSAAQPTNIDGYLVDSRGEVVKSSTGLCVRTSSYNPATTFHPDCDQSMPENKQPMAPNPAPIAPVATFEPTVVVPAVNQQMRVEVLFNFDSHTLNNNGKRNLDKLVKNFDSQKVNRVVIRGHADPIGSSAYNLNLSKKRASSVQRYLSSVVDRDMISVNSVGENELKVNCEDTKTNKNIICNAPNRRVEVIMDTRN